MSESRAAEAEAAETDAPGTEALTVERNDLLARLQRVSADFINYQKRVQRDITEARDFANADLIRELLGVLDDMERALQAARANHSQDDPLLAGMQLVYGKALEVLGRFGLQPIEAQGRPFDPTRHEAMMQQPSAEHQSPTVLSELQRGYELKGRVLRPARVVVSSPPQEGEARGDEHACGGTAEDE
ncbi:MAG: hypothetical protein AMJ81_00875 [Phycisphaerae bacterium SM23_33]|nr:MAG: hypothetical protein AMJ81_00875 [Phycisphaerae bacterium SM23_33]